MNKQRAAFGAAIILLAWLPFAVNVAYPAMWQWSGTASSNASADPTINWREGQAPSTVNDSARALMAVVANYRDDISGSLFTGGSSTAYSVTTNQGLCLSPSTTPQDGQLLAISMHATNGASPSLQTDTCSAFPIQSSQGNPVGAGTLITGSPYTLKFNLAFNAWILRDLYANPYSISLGGILWSTASTAPNSNFVLAAGNCLNTTTYATYWSLLGNPSPSGGCPSNSFLTLDLRGRTLVGLDNMGGSAANRLTASSSGCGTSMTSLGATCANGGESETLSQAQLPSVSVSVSGSTSGYTPNIGGAGIQAVNGHPAAAAFTASGGNLVYQSNQFGDVAGFGSLSVGGNTGNLGSNVPHPVVNPNIAVYAFLRVI